MKKLLYNSIAKIGIRLMSKFFPEYFASEPLKPTDKYIEYPFAIRNLPSKPARVLDVGCSGGLFPLLLSAIGYDTWGMDIRPYALENKSFKFILGDICQTKFTDNYFKVVTCISTLEHIGLAGRYGASEDKNGDIKALNEMLRIGRTVILTIPVGIARTIKPFTRIYSSGWIDLLGINIKKEEYYDKNLMPIDKSAVGDIKSDADNYALGLYVLSKEG